MIGYRGTYYCIYGFAMAYISNWGHGCGSNILIQIMLMRVFYNIKNICGLVNDSD